MVKPNNNKRRFETGLTWQEEYPTSYMFHPSKAFEASEKRQKAREKKT